MVRKSFLSLIREAVKFLLCAAEPLLGDSRDVSRNEPESPSSTRAIYGSLPSPNYRQSFYLHRNSPILAECTTPTIKSPTDDQKPASNIQESKRNVDSAKEPGSSGNTEPDTHTHMYKPTDISRDPESRSNRRTHQNSVDSPEVEDEYIRKIAAIDIATLQAAKNHLLAMSNDINTRIRHWMPRPTYHLEATHQDTIPADTPAHHNPAPAPESEQHKPRPPPSL
jgi:hypothetical protein